MERLCILAAVSAIVIALTFYPSTNRSFLKMFYKELVSRNVPTWKKMDVVEEKHAFEELFGKDVSWGMVELVVGGTAACVLSLVIGWRLNSYRYWYEKKPEVNSEDEKILQKFIQMEKHVFTMEQKMMELQEKYAMLNNELNFSRELIEKEMCTTDALYEKIDSDSTDKCCQTTMNVSYHKMTPVVYNNSASQLHDTPQTNSLSEDWQLDPDLISNINEKDQSENFVGDLNVTTINEEIQNKQQITDLTSSKSYTTVESTGLVFNGNTAELYPVEMDVVQCETSPGMTGCGESKSRRISQYKQPPYPPMRVSTPRRYSTTTTSNQNISPALPLTPNIQEVTEPISGASTNRRRKQRNIPK